MIEELERLSYALGSISRDEARRVCEIVNRKLMDLLAAQVIKIYWTTEAEDGILLSPIAFINNAQKQIRRSHFCIADMTGLNANVVAEVAMMIVLRKHFILMRRQGDATPIPFDFNQYQFVEYEATAADQGLRVWDTSQNRYQPFSDVLDRFIERVPPETGFASAQRFRSD